MIRVETRLVQVDVVVRDSDGPIRGLTVEDFRLFDDGVEQEIAFFEATAIEDTALPVETAGGPAGIVSNRPGLTGETLASATVLLIDRLNTGVMQQARAMMEAVEFLQSLDPRHQVAIYELTTQLRLIQDYSIDRAQLIAALTGADTEYSSQLTASSGAGFTGGFEALEDEVGLDPILAQARTNPGGGIEAIGTLALDREVALYYRENRLETTAGGLESIATQMAHLPGRKSLVWIAGSFPFSFDPYSYFRLGEVGYDVKRTSPRRISGDSSGIWRPARRTPPLSGCSPGPGPPERSRIT